ncbi:MAG: hypothetical protein ACLQU1_08425 [Bryobacteraceae bacterium]
MVYVAVNSARLAIERVANRADAGGHSAPGKVLRETYHLSLGHLPIAIRQFDEVFVFDNTALAADPILVLEASKGSMHHIPDPPPRWLKAAIKTITALKYEE